MQTKIVENWNNYLEFIDKRAKDIYFCEEYVKLYQNDTGKALCAICQDDEKLLLLPFIRKEIDGYYDFETAYGYSGPITNTLDSEWITMALGEMRKLFARERYVCGFVRFHSLLANVNFCKSEMLTYFDRNTIAIYTEPSEEDIWKNQINSKNRNMIRKAEKNGLEYNAEFDFKSMDEFIELYNATMHRLNAEEFYFFDYTYYKTFADNFKNHAFLGTVRKDGILICAAIFMYSDFYGHYHLEGSNHNYSNLAANNLLLWKTALEFHKLGIKEFHLGGGYDSNSDNSLYKFKKAFSNNIKDFYIGKWIFNEKKYNELKQEWGKKYPEKIQKYKNMLLCYRY